MREEESEPETQGSPEQPASPQLPRRSIRRRRTRQDDRNPIVSESSGNEAESDEDTRRQRISTRTLRRRKGDEGGRTTSDARADTLELEESLEILSGGPQRRKRAIPPQPTQPRPTATPRLSLRSRRRASRTPAPAVVDDTSGESDSGQELRIEDSQRSRSQRRFFKSQMHSVPSTPLPSNSSQLTQISPTLTAKLPAQDDDGLLALEESIIGDESLEDLIAEAEDLDSMTFSRSSHGGSRIPLDLTLSPISALGRSSTPHLAMSDDDDRIFGTDESDLELLETQSRPPSPKRVIERRKRNAPLTPMSSTKDLSTPASAGSRPVRRAAAIARNEMWLAAHPTEVSTDARAWRAEQTRRSSSSYSDRRLSLSGDGGTDEEEDEMDLEMDLGEFPASSSDSEGEEEDDESSPASRLSLSPQERSRRAQKEMRDKVRFLPRSALPRVRQAVGILG